MDGMDELRSPSLPTSPAAPVIAFPSPSMLSVLQLLGTIRCPKKPRAAQRRPFYELAQSGPAPIAAEALLRIAALYRIEAEIRGRSADERRGVRHERSRPLVEALEPWLREKLALVSQKSRLAEAIRYALSRWTGLCLFLADGRVELDTNVVERSMRPLGLTRKNALFAGSDDWASKYGRLSLPGRMGARRGVPSCAVWASRPGVGSRMA